MEVLVNKVTLLWWSEFHHLNVTKVSVKIQLVRGVQADMLAPNWRTLIFQR